MLLPEQIPNTCFVDQPIASLGYPNADSEIEDNVFPQLQIAAWIELMHLFVARQWVNDWAGRTVIFHAQIQSLAQLITETHSRFKFPAFLLTRSAQSTYDRRIEIELPPSELLLDDGA